MSIKEPPPPITSGELDYSTLDELDAEGFAKWLSDAYRRSPFKSLTELAAAVGSNKATISRLMSGASQTLTGKPSRPRAGLVVALAQALNADEAEGLYYAGHVVMGRSAKKPKTYFELIEALEAIGVSVPNWHGNRENIENYTEEDFQDLLDRIALDTDFSIRRKQK